MSDDLEEDDSISPPNLNSNKSLQNFEFGDVTQSHSTQGGNNSQKLPLLAQTSKSNKDTSNL